jgi:carbonic anhydrase/acetyltransferase-like protein (isoleucine patch superfamily)
MHALRTFALRCLLKLASWARKASVSSTDSIASSRGFGGVLQFLESVDGEDAVSILRSRGAQIGAGTLVLRGLVIHNAERDLTRLRVGERCHLGRQTFIDLAGSVVIGDRVTISMRCMLITHTNVGDSRCGLATSTCGIEIGDDVYIGAGTTLLPGVKLGPKSIIGAGSVVVHDIAPGAVVVGVPARVVPQEESRGHA